MKKEKRTVKVTEKKLADGIIKLDCEATAIEVNNALKEAAEAFAMQMGVRPAPGKSIEELAREQAGHRRSGQDHRAQRHRGARASGARSPQPRAGVPSQGHAHGEVRSAARSSRSP